MAWFFGKRVEGMLFNKARAIFFLTNGDFVGKLVGRSINKQFISFFRQGRFDCLVKLKPKLCIVRVLAL
jgi:hypothetical protein